MRKIGKTTENVLIIIVALIALGVVILMDRAGMPQKWHAAVIGTVVTFVGISLVFQRQWQLVVFWQAFGICFGVHLIALWLIFEKVLAPVHNMGILIWAPMAFGEGVLLLAMIPILERRVLSRRRWNS